MLTLKEIAKDIFWSKFTQVQFNTCSDSEGFGTGITGHKNVLVDQEIVITIKIREIFRDNARDPVPGDDNQLFLFIAMTMGYNQILTAVLFMLQE